MDIFSKLTHLPFVTYFTHQVLKILSLIKMAITNYFTRYTNITNHKADDLLKCTKTRISFNS